MPCSCAFCHDSSRRLRPAQGLGATATSPAARMWGSDVRHWASTSTPPSQARPASRASSSLGTRPTPSTMVSHASALPSASKTSERISAPSAPSAPSAARAKPRTPAPSNTRTPWARCSANRYADTSAGTVRSHKRLCVSTTTTSAPCWRAVAATSRPIQPPPTTTTLRPGRRAGASACASSMVRSVCSGTWSAPGTASRRARPPVHRMSLS